MKLRGRRGTPANASPVGAAMGQQCMSQTFLAPPQNGGEPSHLFRQGDAPVQTIEVYLVGCGASPHPKPGSPGDALSMSIPLSGPVAHTPFEVIVAGSRTEHPALSGRDVLRFIVSFELIRALVECDEGARLPGNRYASVSVTECPGGHGKRRIALAKEILIRGMDVHPDMQVVAEACGLSLGAFHRAFREATGTPPLKWLRTQRLERAKSLLAEGVMSLADIAGACGFADQSHFTRTFTHAAGVAPGRWRRSQKPNTDLPMLAGRLRPNHCSA